VCRGEAVTGYLERGEVAAAEGARKEPKPSKSYRTVCCYDELKSGHSNYFIYN
jgi:hypothetical protein